MLERLTLLPVDSLVISIAGTNGKGSCVAMLESIYSAAGFRVGSFTSPHLLRFNERIRVCQHHATDDEIYSAFEWIERMRGDLQIGYFQFSFLAALLLFKKSNLDIILLEVGIGGLNDAVNALDANLAVLTQIGLDHCQLLGQTRELIAKEKAGIMRANCPAVCGDSHPPKTLFHAAEMIGAHLFCLNKDFSYVKREHEWCWKYRDFILDHLPLPSLFLQNAATTLMAIHLLQKQYPVSEEAIKLGLHEAHLVGRQQPIKYQGFDLLLDVSHNVDGIALLVKKLKTLHIAGKKRVIFGVKKEKDFFQMMNRLNGVVDVWYLTSTQDHSSASYEVLQKCAIDLSVNNFYYHPDPVISLHEAMKHSEPGDLIIICGSFLTVASVLRKISDKI